MVFDTNIVIAHVRRRQHLPVRAVLPIVVMGELKSLALRGGWGPQKISFLEQVLDACPSIEITAELTDVYAAIDAYSQGKLPGQPLPRGMSARNMGKNDLWIATTALYLAMPLCTADHDFDHLAALGLVLASEPLA